MTKVYLTSARGMGVSEDDTHFDTLLFNDLTVSTSKSRMRLCRKFVSTCERLSYDLEAYLQVHYLYQRLPSSICILGLSSTGFQILSLDTGRNGKAESNSSKRSDDGKCYAPSSASSQAYKS